MMLFGLDDVISTDNIAHALQLADAPFCGTLS